MYVRGCRTSAVACGILLLMSACATRTKQEWLQFFFDGVPSENEQQAESQAKDDSMQGPQKKSRAALMLAARESSPVQVIHEPYANNDCMECHESNQSQRMKGPMIDVCFECHDDFLTDITFQHDPAAVGDCMDCHDPHMSVEPSLLILPQRDLCFECHDVFEEKFVHEPAGAGDCQECHDAHASDIPALLVMPEPPLCYECHEEVEVTNSEAHRDIDLTSCTQCHDPHQGADKFYLKDGARHAAWTD